MPQGGASSFPLHTHTPTHPPLPPSSRPYPGAAPLTGRLQGGGAAGTRMRGGGVTKWRRAALGKGRAGLEVEGGGDGGRGGEDPRWRRPVPGSSSSSSSSSGRGQDGGAWPRGEGRCRAPPPANTPPSAPPSPSRAPPCLPPPPRGKARMRRPKMAEAVGRSGRGCPRWRPPRDPDAAARRGPPLPSPSAPVGSRRSRTPGAASTRRRRSLRPAAAAPKGREGPARRADYWLLGAAILDASPPPATKMAPPRTRMVAPNGPAGQRACAAAEGAVRRMRIHPSAPPSLPAPPSPRMRAALP